MSTLYQDMIDASIRTENHESDLYVPDTEDAREILGRYPTSRANATRFTSQIDGKQWIDIPFMYTPYWDAKPR